MVLTRLREKALCIDSHESSKMFAVFCCHLFWILFLAQASCRNPYRRFLLPPPNPLFVCLEISPCGVGLFWENSCLREFGCLGCSPRSCEKRCWKEQLKTKSTETRGDRREVPCYYRWMKYDYLDRKHPEWWPFQSFTAPKREVKGGVSLIHPSWITKAKTNNTKKTGLPAQHRVPCSRNVGLPLLELILS